MTLHFAKYEGLGNDFVVIEVGPDAAHAADGEAQVLPEITADQAQALCDRHRGIGADGVLLVDWPKGRDLEPQPRMRVINADGSRPEMCGNGLRCVALHLVRRGHAESGRPFTVATDAGPHVCRVAPLPSDGVEAAEVEVEVSMRPASLVPAEIPVLAGHEVVDAPFEVAGTTLKLTCVSMGNPHAVTFDDLGPSARSKLGPLLEKDARFPNAANIGFARLLGPQSLELSVWERGVGFTEACGTGACACAVAAVETGRAERGRPIAVRLPGGVLTIRVGERHERISMTGPARFVFNGTTAQQAYQR
ncbi:MAG: hypothetical protein RL701_2560 [Pseudomonadota bacterium]